jgi:hypothetical protein
VTIEVLEDIPEGLVPGLSWLLQRIREFFDPSSTDVLCEDLFEEALELFEDELVGIETVVAEEPEHSPFCKLWEICDELLDGVVSAWDGGCESYLESSSELLAKAYEYLTAAEQELHPEHDYGLKA